MPTNIYQVQVACDTLPVGDRYVFDQDQVLDHKLSGFGDTIKNALTIDGKPYDMKVALKLNDKAGQNLFSRYVDSLKKDCGWRLYKTLENAYNITQEVGLQLPEGVDEVASRCGAYWKWAAVAKVLPTSREAVEACQKAMTKEASYLPGEESYRITQAYQKTFGAVAMGGYGTSAVADCFPTVVAKQVARKATNIANAADAVDNAFQFLHALGDYLYLTTKINTEKATKDVQQNVVETARLALIKVAKSVCSLAGFLFGTMLFLGTPIVSPLVALTVALGGNLFATSSDLYETGMQHKPFPLHDSKHLKIALTV